MIPGPRALASGRGLVRRGRTGQAAFWGVGVLAFAASATLTVLRCGSMPGGMAMPGGWTMSMAWMRMPGQTWTAAAAAFLGMWVLMMMAMMLPSLIPMLLRYRETAAGARMPDRAGGRGLLLRLVDARNRRFAVGSALAAFEMRHPALAGAVPAAGGMAVLIAGALQFTAWKTNLLVCCRAARVHCLALPPRAEAAWRHGLRLGLDCVCCCAGLTVVLLVLGVMNLGAMVAVTVAISAEHLLPHGEHAERTVGYVVVGGGLLLIARAAGLG